MKSKHKTKDQLIKEYKILNQNVLELNKDNENLKQRIKEFERVKWHQTLATQLLNLLNLSRSEKLTDVICEILLFPFFLKTEASGRTANSYCS